MKDLTPQVSPEHRSKLVSTPPEGFVAVAGLYYQREGKWLDTVLSDLRGVDVALVHQNDPRGQSFMGIMVYRRANKLRSFEPA